MATTRTSIPKPDVTVQVVTRTVSPTVTTPVLPACVVGPCYQVLDPQLSTGLAPNPDALVELPASIRSYGQAVTTAALASNVTVALVVNGVSTSTIFASGSTYTVAQIVAAITASLSAAGSAAVCGSLGTGTETRFYIKTVGAGAGNYIDWLVTDAAAGADAIAFAETALKLPRTWHAEGASGYSGTRLTFQSDDYPDPLGIGTDIDVDDTTVRVFADLSGGMSEWLRTSRVVRGGNATLISYPDDGDGDGYTPLVAFGGVATPSDILPSAAVPGLIAFTGGAATQLNWTSAAFAGGVTDTLYMSLCGSQEQAIDISNADNAVAVCAKINARFPNVASGSPININAASLSASFDEIEYFGRDSVVTFRGTGPLLTALFGAAYAAGVMQRGTWHNLSAPAELWVDGEFLGNIIEVTAAQLRLDREIREEAAAARNFVIKKTGLPATMDGSITAWAPDLVVASSAFTETPEGTTRVGHELLRDANTGAPMVLPLTTTASCSMYMGYTGLRLDTSPSSTDPGLVAFNDATDLIAELPPIDTSNPLGLGLYFAMLNAPGVTVYGLSVDEVSTAYPDGTRAAYAECAEFLESKAVYSIALLTQDVDIAKDFQVHVDLMSQPAMRSERILWWCPELPTRERPVIIASGVKGNCGPIPGASGTFHTAIPDLAARLAAAGVTITGVPDTDRVYLQTTTFGEKMFAITAVAGPDITIADYAPGTPDLGFEADISLSFTAALVDEPFTIAQLGASLYSGTVYDKAKASEAIYDLGQEFADRRVRMVIPDEVLATISGLEMAIPGYYACCCLAGMKSYYGASQGFTNLAVTGLTGVQRTQGFFSEEQLNLMAGGGSWILIPTPSGIGVQTRMSLTTDTSSVEYRQDSWTSALDYTAYMLRDRLRSVIGPTNITDAALNLVATLTNGVLERLVKDGVLLSASIDSVAQSTTSPDTIEVAVTVQVPYNLMYVTVTITV